MQKIKQDRYPTPLVLRRALTKAKDRDASANQKKKIKIQPYHDEPLRTGGAFGLQYAVDVTRWPLCRQGIH